MSIPSLDFQLRTPSLGLGVTAIYTLELVNIEAVARPFTAKVTLPTTVAGAAWTAMATAGSTGVPAAGVGAFDITGTIAPRGQAIFTITATLNTIPVGRTFQCSTLVASGGVAGEVLIRAAQVIQGDDTKVRFRTDEIRPYVAQQNLSSQFFDLDEGVADPAVVWQAIDRIQNEQVTLLSFLSGGSLGTPVVDNDTIQVVAGALTAIGGRIIPGYLGGRAGTLDALGQFDISPAYRPEVVMSCTTDSTTLVAVPSTVNLRVGQTVEGTNIPAATTIDSIGIGTVTLSAPATTTGTLSLTFGALDIVAPVLTPGTVTTQIAAAIAPLATTASQTAAIAAAIAPLATTASQTAAIAAANLVTGNRQTASYTAVLADAGKEIEMNLAGANTFTVPTNAAQAFPIGTVLSVIQYGAGATTVAAAGGVTIRKLASVTLVLQAQYATVVLRKIDTDEWSISGALT